MLRLAVPQWRSQGLLFVSDDQDHRVLGFKDFPRNAAIRSMTGGGAAISLGLTVSPFILASISSRKASWYRSIERPVGDRNGRINRDIRVGDEENRRHPVTSRSKMLSHIRY